MAQYRKRPVVIDAVLNTGEKSQILDWINSMGPLGTQSVIKINDDGSLTINTLEGVMRADKGDYVIRGVKGEFYPCKPDIFDATYERV